jgi:DNA-binding LytR/AlgR family response regulator
MKKILTVFAKPYPLEERKTAQLKLSIIFGLVVFLFLFVLRPFDNNASTTTIIANSAIAGLITSVTIMLDFLVLFWAFPSFFKEEKWTIGREIILTFIVVGSIGTANMLAGIIFWNNKFSINAWANIIFYTALIGIAPATTSILINQARLLRKYKKEANTLNNQLTTGKKDVAEPLLTTEEAIKDSKAIVVNETVADQIIFEAENERDRLIITTANFLAATSADNYVKFYYLENNALKTTILRTTLKRVEETAALLPNFFRCHRIAIVNIAAVKNVSGNAQGYKLQLPHLPEEIPVSRNLNAVLKEKLAAIRP